MTMYVVLGDGEMTRKELTATMDDLEAKASEAEQSFWLLIRAHAEPNATEKTLLGWCSEHETYYEVVGDDLKGADKIYAGAQEKYEVKRLGPKVAGLMAERPEDGEDAFLLALFASDDPDAEEDRWLNDVVADVIEGGFKVLAMNDGLTEISLEEDGEAAEAEPEPPKKTPAKKVAAKAASTGSSEASGDLDVANDTLTREQLEDMELDELKEVAAARGITLPARTRAVTYVNTILGEGDKTPKAEVEDVGETAEEQGANGDSPSTISDLDALADLVVQRIGRALAEAFK